MPSIKECDTSGPPRRLHCVAAQVTIHSVMETCFSSKKSGSSSASNGGGGESADKPELYSLVEGKLAPPNTFESKDSEVNDMYVIQVQLGLTGPYWALLGLTRPY